MPVIPIRSYRVMYRGPTKEFWNPGLGSSTQFAVFEKGAPNWKQVLFIYGYMISLVAWAGLMGMAGRSLYPGGELPASGNALLTIAIFLPVPAPWLLRRYARRRAAAAN